MSKISRKILVVASFISAGLLITAPQFVFI
jgi:hypothetical protein